MHSFIYFVREILVADGYASLRFYPKRVTFSNLFAKWLLYFVSLYRSSVFKIVYLAGLDFRAAAAVCVQSLCME